VFSLFLIVVSLNKLNVYEYISRLHFIKAFLRCAWLAYIAAQTENSKLVHIIVENWNHRGKVRRPFLQQLWCCVEMFPINQKCNGIQF